MCLALLLTVSSILGSTVVDWSSVQAADSSSGQSEVSIDDYLDMAELTGWASVSGAGMDKVTGGGDAAPQIVTTKEEFVSLVSDDVPRVILISGTIEAISSSGGAISIGSNKTIVGMDANAKLKGGITINNKSNIIVSNLIMEGCLKEPRTPDDVINVEGDKAHHIWFNHLDISDGGDGNLDIKSAANYITVSWCKFSYSTDDHDHRLSCLISSGAGDHDEDYGHLKVTYHHNWFADNVDQRMPRVMYGKVHVYNNYYTSNGNSYCIGADCYASVLIENNYFKDVNDPHQFSYPDSTLPATIVARGNVYDNTTGSRAEGNKPNTLGKVAAFEEAPYAYWLDEANDVPTLVQQYAGPQDPDPSATPVPTAVPVPSADPTPQPTAQPTLAPTATPKPAATDAAPKLVTDSERGEVWELQGQNSDRTNGQVVIENPFAGLDLSEEPTYVNGYPTWKNGVTLTYWEYIPSNVSAEGVALTFSGTHRAVKSLDWTLHAEGEDGYQYRFEDNGGTYSLMREGDVMSGLQISTFGSIGFSEDDCVSGWNVNPYSGEYGVSMDFQQKNYFYIFANKSGTRNTLVADKGSWHFVAMVIQNDDIVTYIDGKQVSLTEYNVWNTTSATIEKSGMYVGGQSFNLGFGWKQKYRASSTSECYSHGITLLDFLTRENTVLTIGGGDVLWETLMMNNFNTPKGIRIGDVNGYARILSESEILALMNGQAPTDEPQPTDEPEPTTEPVGMLGDINGDEKITAEDALLALQHAAQITQLTQAQQQLADVNGDHVIDAEDALYILQYSAQLIDSFPAS